MLYGDTDKYAFQIKGILGKGISLFQIRVHHKIPFTKNVVVVSLEKIKIGYMHKFKRAKCSDGP